jgi:hypothetical protein
MDEEALTEDDAVDIVVWAMGIDQIMLLMGCRSMPGVPHGSTFAVDAGLMHRATPEIFLNRVKL